MYNIYRSSNLKLPAIQENPEKCWSCLKKKKIGAITLGANVHSWLYFGSKYFSSVQKMFICKKDFGRRISKIQCEHLNCNEICIWIEGVWLFSALHSGYHDSLKTKRANTPCYLATI